MVLRPWILPDDAGCGWPAEPAPQQLLPLEVTQDGKPDRDAPAFWTIEAVWKWLIAVTKNDTDALARPVGGLNALPTEIRTHVKIDADKGTGEDGMLFGTENLVFPDVPHPGVLKPDAPVLAEEPAKAATSPYRKQPVAEMAIVAAVSNAPDEGWFDGLTFLPLGGERRIATVRTGESVKFDPLDLPPGFDWSQVQGLRLLLVTPALFERGWYPGWLTSDDGPLAGFALVSAATGRPNAISGWDLERGSMNATRSAVPAGSVYFFRLKDEPQGEPKRDQAARAQALESVFTTLREQWWLKPVSDLQQDRIDGYGLMLPGVW
jgi:CRISPR-associated protein Cmr3